MWSPVSNGCARPPIDPAAITGGTSRGTPQELHLRRFLTTEFEHSPYRRLASWGETACESGLVVAAFVTNRLALRPVSSDDLELLADLNSDASVMEFITGRASSVDETEVELEASIGARWLVFARGDGQFFGWVGGVPAPQGDEYDIGWRFKRSAWGHGYATEATEALIGQLFAEGAQRVFAQSMAVNARSRAVMERLGLRHCATVHLDLTDPLPGSELGEVEYELTRADWASRNL